MPNPLVVDRGFAGAPVATVPRLRPWRLVLEPGVAARNYWADLWRYRELLYFLAWRDTVVRYKQTAMGVAWALLRPACAGLRGIPTPVRDTQWVGARAVLVFAAVLPWQFFSGGLTSRRDLIANADP